VSGAISSIQPIKLPSLPSLFPSTNIYSSKSRSFFANSNFYDYSSYPSQSIYPSSRYSSFLFAESIKKSPPCQKLLPLTLKLVLAFGLLQVIFFSDLRFLYQFGWDDHYFRLTFPLFDPNLTGIILIFAHLYFNKLSSLLAIILTFSRSTYLTLLSLKPKFISLVILLFGLSFFISTKFGEGLNLFRTYSITKRLETFQNFEISFLGDGQYHRFPNTYTNILATSGLLGFIALIYYLIINLKNTPKKSLARSATFALLIHSLFNPSFFHPSIFLIFSLIQSRASPTSPSNSE